MRVTVAWARIAGYAGVGAFVLLVAGALVAPLWDAPDTTAPAAQVSSYFQEHRGQIIAALFLYSLGMGFFLVFAAGLWGLLRESEPGPGVVSAAFAFGAVALAALVLAGFVPYAVMAYRSLDPALAHPLRDLGFGLVAFSGIPTIVCMAAYAELVLRYRALPAWTGWLAAVGAVAHLVVVASFMKSSGFFSLEGEVIVAIPATLFGWILAAGFVLLRVRPAEASAQP
jgi:hypothetical protein